MTWNIVMAIIAVPVLTATLALAIVWHVRSTMSEDPSARRRARLVEVLTSFAVVLFSGITVESARWRKWIFVTIGIVVAACLFRGARLLLRKA